MEEKLTLDALIAGEFQFGIIGLGVENKSFLKWLLHVAKIDPQRILLADQKIPDIELQFNDFGGVFFGTEYLNICLNSEVKHIFKAPGIWSLKPEFEEFRKKKGENSVHSSLCFFIDKFRDNCIGITGSKGKSTTSALITYLIKHPDFSNEYKSIYDSIPSVIYTGNTTNTSPYDYWKKLNDPINQNQYYVLELSSFQLQDLSYDQLSPARSVITNYYIDHQDQHASVEEYWKAKDGIFKFQQNDDFFVATDQIREKAHIHKDDRYVNWIEDNLADSLLQDIPTNLIGHHNKLNTTLALFTVISVLYRTIPRDQILKKVQLFLQEYPTVFVDFEGLKHRLEVVASLNTTINLQYQQTNLTIPVCIVGIDDSQSTMPEASRAGLLALTEKSNDIVWLIISGKDKGGDVKALCKTILDIQAKNKIFQADYYGQIGLKILNTIYTLMGSPSSENSSRSIKLELPPALADVHVIINDLQAWFQDKINQSEEIGDIHYIQNLINQPILNLYIVLAPCGSSFDEFNNAYERGDWFTAIIKQTFHKKNDKA